MFKNAQRTMFTKFLRILMAGKLRTDGHRFDAVTNMIGHVGMEVKHQDRL